MIRIYGKDDFTIIVEHSEYSVREIGCYESYARFFFEDDTIMQMYCPRIGAEWKVIVENKGDAHSFIDENGAFFIDSEIREHQIVDIGFFIE